MVVFWIWLNSFYIIRWRMKFSCAEFTVWNFQVRIYLFSYFTFRTIAKIFKHARTHYILCVFVHLKLTVKLRTLKYFFFSIEDRSTALARQIIVSFYTLIFLLTCLNFLYFHNVSVFISLFTLFCRYNCIPRFNN